MLRKAVRPLPRIVHAWIDGIETSFVDLNPRMRLDIDEAREKGRKFSAQLARGLLGEDGKECAAMKDFDEATINRLRTVAAKTLQAPPPPK